MEPFWTTLRPILLGDDPNLKSMSGMVAWSTTRTLCPSFSCLESCKRTPPQPMRRSELAEYHSSSDIVFFLECGSSFGLLVHCRPRWQPPVPVAIKEQAPWFLGSIGQGKELGTLSLSIAEVR